MGDDVARARSGNARCVHERRERGGRGTGRTLGAGEKPGARIGTRRDFTRPKESDDYARQREARRVAEHDLIDHVERVAALRRQLPDDTFVDDYQLIDVTYEEPVRLSNLFT